MYMVSTSLKPNGTEYEFPIRWIPNPVAWENYPKAFTSVTTLIFLKNTLIITAVSLVGEVLTASLVAYGFARLRFPGRSLLFVAHAEHPDAAVHRGHHPAVRAVPHPGLDQHAAAVDGARILRRAAHCSSFSCASSS